MKLRKLLMLVMWLNAWVFGPEARPALIGASSGAVLIYLLLQLQQVVFGARTSRKV